MSARRQLAELNALVQRVLARLDAMAGEPGVDPDGCVTVAEAAELLTLCEDEVRNLVESGELAAARHGRRWIIPRSALRGWVAAKTATRRDLRASGTAGRPRAGAGLTRTPPGARGE